MRRWIVVPALMFAFASSAHAAPGDPRLVQGILEWPAKLTVEPFVVVRTEDGRWYYAEIKAAKRLESAPLTAGARVAVLGTEATRPHEITAIALGSGDAAALAMALMPHVGPAVAASAPPSPPAAESPSPPKPTATEPPPTPKTIARPEPPTATVPAPATAPAPPTKALEPSTSHSTPLANPHVAEKPKEKLTPVKTTAPADPIGQSKPSPSVSAGPASTRWTELRGTVHAVAGHWVVVRADDGQSVLVDFSALRGAAASLTPGSPIVVYGTRGEEKFQAVGIVQQETRPPAKPVAVPPRP
ncbi:MAG: hypothetical protein DMD91_27870 [Candidatus Rokuibacteriota bacterium]|nr:MAG: hypothetical protein DMD91_27870 [Candidatus Rokubacteria bacterium]